MFNKYFILIIAILFNSIASLFLKMGSDKLFIPKAFELNQVQPLFKENLNLILGVILFGISFMLSTFIYSKFKLSIVQPMLVGGTILTVNLISFFYLKEKITTSQMIGVFLLISGLVLLSDLIKFNS